MALFPSTSISSAAGGYDIDNSCRFDADSSAKLTQGSFQPGSAYTVSFWVKRGSLGTAQYAYRHNSADHFNFTSSDTIELERRTGNFTTTQVFRDTSAWYHMHIKTTSSAFTLYVNGVQAGTATNSSNPYSSGNLYIGTSASSLYFDGYLAEFHWIDGSSLDPDSFGEAGDYGEWKPKEYTGSHGTDGFYLDFKNSGSLGNDAAGSNNFTPTNLAASDQMTDSPTNNFSTLNSNWQYSSSQLYMGELVEGNLKTTISGHGPHTNPNTIPVSSGKWYWETLVHNVANNAGRVGICTTQCLTRDGTAQAKVDTILLRYDGALMIGTGATTYTGYSSSFATGTQYVLSFMLNLDDNQIEIKKDNVTGGGVKSIPAGEYEVMADFMSSGGEMRLYYNWGQDGTFCGEKTAQGNSDSEDIGNFYYTVPSGFKALCTKNFPEPAVKPGEHFNTILYDDGAGAKTGVGFQPDLVWLKSRGSAYEHELTDAVRGVTKALSSDNNPIETTDSTGLTAFGSDGFTVGTDNNYDDTTGDGMVAWCWKANGLGSSNTDGTINTTYTSANVSAGFSISTYAGNGVAGATIGHGLSVAPNLVIVKRRDVGIANWQVGSVQSLASLDFTDYLMLDTTNAFDDSADQWNDQNPTASVVYLGTQGSANASGSNYVAYCFHDVEGYSKIGSYAGNGNTNGTFVYCGFRPKWLICKRISGYGWIIKDSIRDTTNVIKGLDNLYAHDPALEGNLDNTVSNYVDFLSNGFKMRSSDANATNSSTNPYLFYAIAETPFKYTTAR